VVEPDRSGRAVYRALNSCLVLLPSLAGLEVWTAEGISGKGVPDRGGPAGGGPAGGGPAGVTPSAENDGLHPVQVALADAGGSQCGYCTPGFVMSLFADHYPRPGRARPATTDVLAGNLCRCTGYRPIRAAAEGLRQAGPAAGDVFAARLEAPAPTRPPLDLRHGVRRYYRPPRLEEALAILADDPQARPIAGGTDLVLEVTKAFRPLPSLVSLEGIASLRRVRRTAHGWEIGGAATLTEVAEAVGGAVPLLRQMLPLFASLQIRNRATVGGNLCTASPIGDLSPVLLALDAVVVVTGPAGEREVPLSRFFTAYRETALRRGELLTAVRLPHPPAGGRRLGRAYKVAKRSRVDISTVAAAFCLDLDGAGRIARARLAYGGVAPTPARAPRAEAALEGRIWDEAALEGAQAELEATFSPISDLRGGAAFRRALVRNLLARFFEETAAP
jgi:xanthine dehydrogenase small subunit